MKTFSDLSRLSQILAVTSNSHLYFSYEKYVLQLVIFPIIL